MSRLPRLGEDTMRSRAAMSNQVWEARQRARRATAAEFDTIDDPDEVPIRRRGRGFGAAPEFLEWAEPQEAAHHLDPAFPRQNLGPGDVERLPDDQGFGPTEGVQRQRAAFEFEDDTRLEAVDPDRDIVDTPDGFGLAEPRQRDLVAMELDAEFPRQDLTRDDIEAVDDGFRPAERVEQQRAAFELDEQFGLVDLGFDDVQRQDDVFGLTPDAEREVAAAQFVEETPLEAVDPHEDIRRTNGEFELRESVIEANIGLFR